MKVGFCSLIFTLLTLLSCNKEETIEKRTYIYTGDINNGMIISTLEKPDTIDTRYLYNNYFELPIDLNKDGQNEIKIGCWKDLSAHSGGGELGIYVEPLDNQTSTSFTERMDTVFYYYEENEDTIISQSGYMEINSYNYYEIPNRHNSDSVYSINRNIYSKPFNDNDTISIFENWINEKLIVRFSKYYVYNGFVCEDEVNHILYLGWNVNREYYGICPIEEYSYIGIKHNDQLGWIKIKINSEYSLIIYEYAIQK